jgi:hypothetical protein
MKRLLGFLLGTSFALGFGTLQAQEMKAGETTTPPPKVLVIQREFVKPGKQGSVHEKSESAFVQAFARAKWPTHYLAVQALSGKSRCLFLIGYDSFADWEKDNLAQEKNAALTAAIDRAALADGELLSDYDAGVFIYREDYSLRAPVDIAHMRYFDISTYTVRPGHRPEWDEAVKLVKAAYEKIPDAHWAMYQRVYGQGGTEFAIFTPMKSASEIDQSFEQDKQFMAAMGEDGMKRLRELESSAVEASQSNLFQFNPKMSYVDESWIKADPEFWKPKPAAPMSAPKKAAEKPAGAQ